MSMVGDKPSGKHFKNKRLLTVYEQRKQYLKNTFQATER